MTEHKNIRGGALLARAFKKKGVEHAFTLAGGFCNPALEGFMECQMPVINCPHEQVAGHLADGHARISRKPTLCLVGPEGFANAVPAMLEAWGERSPVIFVTGSSTLKRQGSGGFKEIDDVAIAAPLTKYSAQIVDGHRISEFVDRAWKAATTGYPGPVHLALPVDIMFSSFPENAGLHERPFDRTDTPSPRAWPDPSALAPILDTIRHAKRPLIIAGHGVWWSRSETQLSATGTALRIPVYNVPYHTKNLSEASECYMGLADFHQYHPSKPAIHEADVVVMVGCRLDNQMNFGNPPFIPENTKLICVNGSHEELDYNHAADMQLLSDPGAFLEALAEVKKTWDDWFNLQVQRRQTWVQEWSDHIAAESAMDLAEGRKMHPLQLGLDVQAEMNDGDWLIFDGGNTHFWNEIGVNVAAQRGLKLGGILHPGNYSLLGVGVSFAFAAKHIHPEKNAVLITGDGAFLSGGLSIETCFQEKVPIIVIVDNNGGLDCISQQQERLFENGQHYATDFRDIPFHGMFEGLGGHGELVTKREEFAPAMQRAIASGKTSCINVKCRGVISPIVAATSDKREKASIE
ncbi:thiamine pyrophosphate-binding protein [Candidatus Njordibacter sp. Uisw_039]|jgi:acetolactate synthase-1/2/3 large subunit|uniref:thiamine pyrophosphate-binding protein n=1 Tax=Candidatus Njordibacter sp. Uisw_039 TaxID=3230972 RepID=UPI003D378510|tara:strand:+ start:3656 stop:5386 length:1731 start_codon:yes stop_codon:yes gene_type:complete